MPCTDRRAVLGLGLGSGLLVLAGCSQPPAVTDGRPAAPPPLTPLPPAASPDRPAAAARPPAPAAVPAPPPWRRARDWEDWRQQAALRIVGLDPDGSYLGPVPEPLLAIPVLEVDLNADGSVRRIQVLRRPTQAPDTVQLAIAAMQRASPFGSVAHLPRPWRYTETFLFDDRRRYKPRTLDF